MSNDEGYQEVVTYSLDHDGALKPTVSEMLARQSVTYWAAVITAGTGVQLVTNASGYKVIPYFLRIENNEPVNAVRFEIVDGDPAVAGTNKWAVTVGAGLRWEGNIYPGVCTDSGGVFIDVGTTLTVVPVISLGYWKYKERQA